jgi:hypothetical protein
LYLRFTSGSLAAALRGGLKRSQVLLARLERAHALDQEAGKHNQRHRERRPDEARVAAHFKK